MNTLLPLHRTTILAASVSFALFAGCSAAPSKPDGAENVRDKLSQLQSNADLATRAPLALRDAEGAVRAAEQPQKEVALGEHLVFVADRKVDKARAEAEGHFAVDQRKVLAEQREAMRLQSRTQEADSANRRASIAQADANLQKQDAQLARNEASAARDATADAQRDADVSRGVAAMAQRNEQELQRQIMELEAKVTDRGLVLTLGDLLFTSGTATLNPGANKHLGRLAAFLTKYPERNSLIEGYTDSIGTDDYNQSLSQRRADAVKAYLTGQGIAAARLTASGKGEGSPIGDNSSSTGRQQNRRVEVIIENQLVSAR
jgi:outer membrane protein OmpA-like peptidoglycan-associated protein